MKKHLWLVVEKETRDFDGIEECTGNKTIWVYEMVDNQPNEFTTVECSNEDNSEQMVQEYLDDNGHGDEEFIFHAL
jgi:hypothetical protein